METAKRSGRRTKRDLQEIPEFVNHLRRNNIDFATFEKRQALGAGTPPDTEADALNLARMKVNLNNHKGKRA